MYHVTVLQAYTVAADSPYRPSWNRLTLDSRGPTSEFISSSSPNLLSPTMIIKRYSDVQLVILFVVKDPKDARMSTTTSLSQPSRQRRPQCHICFRSFSRLDHLKRHQLNHDAPKYECRSPGCGLRFHRQDALKRHAALHGKIEPSRTPSADGGSTSMDAVEKTWDSVLEDTDLDFFGWDLSRNPTDNYFNFDSIDFGVIHDLDRESVDSAALDDCIISFRQHDLPRLPCIPPHWNDHPKELQYSMAALGALHIEKYKCLARDFHEKALPALETSSVCIKTHCIGLCSKGYNNVLV